MHACSSSNVPVLPPAQCCCCCCVYIVPHLLVRGNHFVFPLTGVQWLLVVAHIPALLSQASGWVQRFTCVAAKHIVADHQASLLAWSSVGVAYLRVLGSPLSPGLSAWALQAATKRESPHAFGVRCKYTFDLFPDFQRAGWQNAS